MRHEAVSPSELVGRCVAEVVHVFDELRARELRGDEAPDVRVEVVRVDDLDAGRADVAREPPRDDERERALDLVLPVRVLEEAHARCAEARLDLAAVRVRDVGLDAGRIERADEVQQVRLRAAERERLDDVKDLERRGHAES